MALQTGSSSTDTADSRPVIHTNPEILDRYKDLDNIRLLRIESTSEWKDEDLLGKEKLWLPKLEDLESDGDREAYIGSAIECLCKKVTRSSVGALLALAWNMASPDDPKRDVFTRNETHVKEVDKALSTLSNDVNTYAENPTTCILPFAYEKKKRAVAYVAGSALRLLTKPAENYMKSFDHICKSYRNFYREEFPIVMSLDSACVSMTQILLQQRTILKSSVVPFLYHFDELDGGGKVMCRMLYEQHLSFTGIHAYPLFLTAAKELELETDVLIALLNNHLTSYGLDVIGDILDKYECGPDGRQGNTAKREGKHVQRMWKYARIFDEKVFADLQTKNCTFLVTVLAYLNRILGTSGAENVLRIKQIEHLVRRDGSQWEKVAEIIHGWAVGRRERPENRTDKWKMIESDVENYLKKRRENSASNDPNELEA